MSYEIRMKNAGSLGSFPRKREPITTCLADTEYGSPAEACPRLDRGRGRRKRRTDHPETMSRFSSALFFAIVAAILAVMLVTLVLLLVAQEVHQVIGVTARKVIVRVFGVILAALAVQSIFNGLAETHIFG